MATRQPKNNKQQPRPGTRYHLRSEQWTAVFWHFDTHLLKQNITLCQSCTYSRTFLRTAAATIYFATVSLKSQRMILSLQAYSDNNPVWTDRWCVAMTISICSRDCSNLCRSGTSSVDATSFGRCLDCTAATGSADLYCYSTTSGDRLSQMARCHVANDTRNQPVYLRRKSTPDRATYCTWHDAFLKSLINCKLKCVCVVAVCVVSGDISEW